MQTEMEVLLIATISIAFLHTVTGPDHYVPFIALSKSRGWSFSKTLFWTVICGCGHVWSSVLLGLTGAALGWSLSKVRWLGNIRGGIAGWALVVFGITYSIYGITNARREKQHKHFDVYDVGSVYVFEHNHGEAAAPKERFAVTPWVMFLIFVLGPCEPMIPLLYFPAVKNSLSGMILLISVYTIFTLAAMLIMVISGYYGICFLRTEKLEKWVHALGGLTIFICGAGMVFLDW